MTSPPFGIRTPDQRLRVFVSSTLKELAPERKSARGSIERLHLAPVMFELGARPHPPRDLYRAYLAQSDVFLGLYWERYGWVAPGETVSGLEDEYILAPALPKLIYIKETEGAREPRLNDLLDQIRNDDTASFKYFTTPRELALLVEGDLATLLAERFDQSRASEQAPTPPPPAVPAAGPGTMRQETAALPVPLTALIGRAAESRALERMVRAGARLVTITGPGGIGKSRLAIDVANRLVDAFGAGVAFVDLSTVHDPLLVRGAIAEAIGIRDTGDTPLDAKLTGALRARRMLLVLDNFEQVIDAAPIIAELLAEAPELQLLVTSRILLRVSGERGFEVGPLALPALSWRSTLAEVMATPAVALFVERVHAVKPDFEVTEANYVAIGKICVALDGVPLALELAAARVRLLPPAAMLARLNRRLPLLEGGARDLPARQQTLRRTIEWSTQLLGANEKHLLATLGVFEGAFSIDAVEAVVNGGTVNGGTVNGGTLGPSDTEGRDILTLLAGLVDNSLVRQEDRGERAYFSMLATVKEYALEELVRSGERDALRQRHAQYFVRLAQQASAQLLGAQQGQWVEVLGYDRENLRSAVRYMLDQRELAQAAQFAWTLFIYWWVDGNRGEVVGWMQEVLDAGAQDGTTLEPQTRAIALYYTCAISFWQDLDARVVPGLTESAELFRQVGDVDGEALALVSLALALLVARTPDPAGAEEALHRSLTLFTDAGNLWGQAMAQVTMGRVELLQHRTAEALERFRRSLELARQVSDELGEGVALNHLGWASLFVGDVDGARDAFSESLTLSVRLAHGEGIAYGLEGFVAVAASVGNVERAGTLLGASECLHEINGIFNADSFSFHLAFVQKVRESAAAGQFEAARVAGRELTADDAVNLALQV